MYPAPRNPTLKGLSALLLPVDEIRVTALRALPVFDQSHRSASKLYAVEFEQTDELRKLGSQARSGVRGGIHPREPAAPTADINAKEQTPVEQQQQKAESVRGPGRSDRCERQQKRPKPGASCLAGKVTLGRGPVHAGPLRVGVSAANRAAPPLLQAHHRRVVSGHLRLETNNLPRAPAQAKTNLIVLGGEYRRVEPADALERTDSDHAVTAAGIRLAYRLVPFNFAEPVVNGGMWRTLAQPSTDNRDFGRCEQLLSCNADPITGDFAISIEKLNESDRRFQLDEAGKSLIARS